MPTSLGDQSIDVLYEPPDVDAYIIDGPVLVQSSQPKKSKTHGEYCETELRDKMAENISSSSRVDTVFDIYKKDTRKRETEKKRGKKSSVARIIISKDTPVCKNSADVMAVDENKTELFRMIADSLVESYKDDECTVAVRDESVGEEVCMTLLFWYAFSGCDTVAQFLC